MSIPSFSPAANGSPTLDAFKEAAAHQSDVWLDGTRLTVQGSGTTPSGRKIDWVAPTGDAASGLAQALRDSVGPGLASAIAHELGLAPAPGKPLSARTIEKAIEMAETGQQALDGVDFMTQINLSAVAGTSAFQRVCDTVGVRASQLDADARQQIDNAMAQHFASAAQAGQGPVATARAEGWLAQAIRDHLR